MRGREVREGGVGVGAGRGGPRGIRDVGERERGERGRVGEGTGWKGNGGGGGGGVTHTPRAAEHTRVLTSAHGHARAHASERRWAAGRTSGRRPAICGMAGGWIWRRV